MIEAGYEIHLNERLEKVGLVVVLASAVVRRVRVGVATHVRVSRVRVDQGERRRDRGEMRLVCVE